MKVWALGTRVVLDILAKCRRDWSLFGHSILFQCPGHFFSYHSFHLSWWTDKDFKYMRVWSLFGGLFASICRSLLQFPMSPQVLNEVWKLSWACYEVGNTGLRDSFVSLIFPQVPHPHLARQCFFEVFLSMFQEPSRESNHLEPLMGSYCLS